MIPLRALDPVLARDEARVLHCRGDPRLPDGAYAFTEAYCTEPDCDCRRVLLQVIHLDTGKQVATINYGFNPPEPPFEDEGQVFLDPLNPQSEISRVLVDSFEKLMATDNNYVARLHRHYELFKRVVDDSTHADHRKLRPVGTPTYAPAFPRKEPVRRSAPKVGPNEPCSCGSGKKFKKCCGN